MIKLKNILLKTLFKKKGLLYSLVYAMQGHIEKHQGGQETQHRSGRMLKATFGGFSFGHSTWCGIWVVLILCSVGFGL